MKWRFHILLRSWATFCLTLASTSLLAQTTIKGGVGFEGTAGLQMMERVEFQDEFRPVTEASYLTFVGPALADLSTKLPSTTEVIRVNFENPAKLRWYFTDAELRPTNDEGIAAVVVTSYKRKQIAVNTGREVIVQRQLYNALTPEDQAYLLMHEALWQTFGNDSRQPASVVRALTVRLLSPISQGLPAVDFAQELKELVGPRPSPFRDALENDLLRVGVAPPQSPTGLNEFVQECVTASAPEEINAYQCLSEKGREQFVRTAAGCQSLYLSLQNKTLLRRSCSTLNVSLRSLRHFPQLQQIDFMAASLTGLDRLGGAMPQLKNVSLQGQIRDISRLYLPRLKVLYLTGNLLEMHRGNAFPGLPGLEQLFLRDNLITNLDFVSQLPRLKSLDISDNPIEDLCGLNSKSLQLLFAENLPDLNWDGACPVELPSLKTLVLRKNPFETLPSFITPERLPRLESLNVQATAISEFPDLQGFSRLKALAIGNGVSFTLNYEALPQTLDLLYLGPLSVRNGVLPMPTNLPALKTIHLTKIYGLRALQWGLASSYPALTGLSLELADPDLVVAGIPQAIASRLEQLDTHSSIGVPEFLDLDIVRLNSAIDPALLARFPNLRGLHTQLTCNFSGSLDSFQYLRKLQQLSFSVCIPEIARMDLWQLTPASIALTRKKLRGLGYLHDLEHLFVQIHNGNPSNTLSDYNPTFLATGCEGTNEYCPVAALIKPHVNSEGRVIQVDWEVTPNTPSSLSSEVPGL